MSSPYQAARSEGDGREMRLIPEDETRESRTSSTDHAGLS